MYMTSDSISAQRGVVPPILLRSRGQRMVVGADLVLTASLRFNSPSPEPLTARLAIAQRVVQLEWEFVELCVAMAASRQDMLYPVDVGFMKQDCGMDVKCMRSGD